MKVWSVPWFQLSLSSGGGERIEAVLLIPWVPSLWDFAGWLYLSTQGHSLAGWASLHPDPLQED